MNIRILIFIVFILGKNIKAQTIINTEKLFSDDSKPFFLSGELAGSLIAGNASVFLLNYSLNTSYQFDKSKFILLGGGEYISESNNVISNSIFGQLRYTYKLHKSGYLFSFYQLQSNFILLLKRRQLGGLGYKQRIFKFEKDSTLSVKLNMTLGGMVEEEVLDQSQLAIGEMFYTLYPRVISSANFVFTLNDKFTFNNTTYFQFYALNPGDYRLLNESSIIFSILDWLSVDVNFVLRYDSQPPSVLTPYDYNLSVGLIFTY